MLPTISSRYSYSISLSQRVDFKPIDRFDKYTCANPNSPGTTDGYALEWARYYELVPGAQAPRE